jgi:Mrp family chromosome partitioning ATPase/DUF971 family protein
MAMMDFTSNKNRRTMVLNWMVLSMIFVATEVVMAFHPAKYQRIRPRVHRRHFLQQQLHHQSMTTGSYSFNRHRSPYGFPSLLSAVIDVDSSSATITATGANTNISDNSNIPIEWQGEVLSKLRTIIDPDLNTDIVTLGFIQNLQVSTTSTSEYNSNGNRTSTTVSFNVVLTTPACPIREEFKTNCEQNVLQLPWVDHVLVNMTSSPTAVSHNTDPLLSGMAQVGAIIAVSSCKGGVGKSTTAVNLAFALQQLSPNINVAIFDADVYGPSLPTMVQPDNDIVKFIGRQIAPLQRNNVKLMSFGYVSDDPAIMRGPIITQLLDQIISVTQWGSIDYMIIDMPPGTGDIPLTLTQRLNITAAVIVTTPQELSHTDVVRGINMFDSVNVPCVAVVENMAYYEIDKHSTPTTTTSNAETNKALIDRSQLKVSIIDKLKGVEGLDDENDSNTMNGDTATTMIRDGSKIEVLANELVDLVVQQLSPASPMSSASSSEQQSTATERVPIFGLGHTKRLSDQFGIENIYQIPLLSNIASNGDSGTPYVLEYPNALPSRIYKQLATSVVQEVAKIQYNNNVGTSQRPNIEYNKDDHTIVIENKSNNENDYETISPANLRRSCRCASCVEEMTGRQLLQPSTISDTIYPRKMYPTGNYALSVDWSDGHRSLYPYKQIKSLLLSREMANENPLELRQ